MLFPLWNVNPFDRQRAVPGGIRTPNLLIRSQLLYPVELQTLASQREPTKLNTGCKPMGFRSDRECYGRLYASTKATPVSPPWPRTMAV